MQGSVKAKDKDGNEFEYKIEKYSPDQNKKVTNLYVKDFPQEWDEKKLREFFEKYGKIGPDSMKMLEIKIEGKESKKAAFINLDDFDGAKRAIEENHEKEVEGTTMYVAYALSKKERQREITKLA